MADARRRARARRLRVALAVMGVGALVAGVAALTALPPGPAGPVRVGPVQAARGDGADGMMALPGGPFHDVADLGDGRLLAVGAPVAGVPGGPAVRLLRRGVDGWRVASSLDLDPLGDRTRGAPWLVPLDPGRYAVLTPLPAERATRVAAIDVGARGLRPGPVTQADVVATSALGADTDGDGTRELVLDGSALDPAGPTCQSARVVVLDGTSLAPRSTHLVPNERLVATAAVDLDEAPGAELVAYAGGSCPAGPTAPTDRRLVVLRLADGALLRDEVVGALRGTDGLTIPPLALDADGDGRLELVVRGSDGIALVGRGATGAVPMGRGTALGVVPGPDDRPRLLVLGGGRTGSPATAGTLRLFGVAAGPDGRPELAGVANHFRPAGDDVLDAVRRDLLRFAGSPASLPVRLVDLDADGCTELVVPGATWWCPGDGRPATGPTWAPSFLATTLLAIDPIPRAGDGPAVLVAAAIGWDREVRRLAAPGPAAATSLVPGAFRTPPTASFALLELPAAALAGPDPGHAARPLRAGTADARSALVVAAEGTRVLSVGDLVREPPRATDLDRLLAAVRRAPAGSDLQVAGGTATLGAARRGGAVVPDARPATTRVAFPAFAPDGAGRSLAMGEEAFVRVVGISPWGEPSAVALVRRGDPAPPPSLEAEVADLGVPWPFETTLQGSTEPGARVVVGEHTAIAAADGRFAVPVRLPPWPTGLVVRSTAAGGETATLQLSVVGGFDYRRLPLDVAGVVVVIVAGVAGAWRAARSARPAGARVVPPVDGAASSGLAGDGWEIEELPPGR